MTHLVSRMQLFGYQFVRTPMMEFTESLLEDASEAVARQTFRVRDPQANREMGLRADITPQIARIASVRLKQEERPLRIAYGGKVIRAESTGLHGDRELNQAGMELIGNASPSADAEIIIAAVESVQTLDAMEQSPKPVTIDINLPNVLNYLLSKVDATSRDQVREALNIKQIAILEKLNTLETSLMAEMIKSAGNAKTQLETLKSLSDDATIQAAFDHAEKVIAKITEALPDIRVIIDPLELTGFGYYTDLAFSMFVEGVSEEIGRGGRYVVPHSDENAVGFAFHVNALARALPHGETKTPEVVTEETPYGKGKALRDSGKQTITKIS